MSDFQSGVRISQHYALLQYVLERYVSPFGYAVEFGVGSGESTRTILRYMEVVGFDSFQGLPEDWRDGYPKGTFMQAAPMDLIKNPRATLHIGLFEDTLPNFVEYMMVPPSLIHIDCDLYSSTKTVFDHIGHLIKPGCCIVFDEYHSYPGCEDHEARAWREFVMSQPGLRYRSIGYSSEQWAVQIV